MFIRKQPTRISRALALWIVLSHLTSFVAPALAARSIFKPRQEKERRFRFICRRQWKTKTA